METEVKPAPFAYHRPRSLGEALQLLAEHGDAARPLAGGQSLVPMMNMRLARPDHLIDLNDLSELDFIREVEGGFEIGAMTRHRTVVNSELLARLCPILPAVAGTIGHDAIRERGTAGGSLALADPSAQWPLLAVLLDAQVKLAIQTERRSVESGDFFTGVFSTAASSGELLTAARFPGMAARDGWGYRGFTRRHGDFAIIAAACVVTLDAAGQIERLRLAVSGVGDRPVRLDALTDRCRDRAMNHEALAELGRAAAAAVAPHDDAIASAAFRRDLVDVLTVGAVTEAIERARPKP
jgi:carbon-monoxide dehydrogenase medium subunit